MGRVNGVETPCDDIDWCVECDYYENCLPNKDHHKSNFVYVVYGETYYQVAGSYPAVFGVFDNVEDAMKFRKEKIEALWEDEQKKPLSDCKSKEQIYVDINVFQLNDPRVVKIGGYIE